MSPLFPVSLNVRGHRCLVVGGGPVAARKARSLLACGALVTVIAPEISADMEALSPLVVERRPYEAGDVKGFRLVFTATGVAAIDGAVYADAEAAGIWVNSADDLDHCTFAMPSVYRDGVVSVAVSTDGTSPALASWLTAQLGADLEGAGALAELVGAARDRLKASGRPTTAIDWVRLLNGPLPGLVRAGRLDEAAALLNDVVAGVVGVPGAAGT